MRGHHAATLVRRATRCTTCCTPPAMATVAHSLLHTLAAYTSDTKHMHQIPGRGVRTSDSHLQTGLAEPERPAALRAQRSAAPVRRGRAHTGSVRLAAAGGLSQQLSFCLPWLLRPLLSETGDEQPSQAKYSCVHEELGRAGWTRVPIINEVKAWQCQGES